MSEDKVGLLINLFDKETIYTIDNATPKNDSIVEESAPQDTTIESKKEDSPKPQTPSLSPFGNNKRGIVILIEEASQDYVPVKVLSVLGKIFEALKLNLKEDSYIINLAQNPTTKREDLISYTPKLIINFGINMFKIGFGEVEFLQYEMKEVDGILVLTSDSIDKMTAKVDAKKAFWLAIQRAVASI